MDKAHPWEIYPRPQLVRDSYLSLNGSWDFEISPYHEAPENYSKSILVPFPPESLLSGLEISHGANEFLYYRRVFRVSEDFIKSRTLLHFGAVDQIATVYLNGTQVGTHEGGYLPFTLDVTDTVRPGENELAVEVCDELSHIYPYGKQRTDRGGMWYTPISGIWQSVWMESVPCDYIEDIKITPGMTDVKIEVKTGAKTKKLTLCESGECFEFTSDEITVAPRDAINWTPENPYLYYFTLEAGEDKIESYFALRTIGVANGEDGIPRITLNGEPYFFNGLLDQGYYPDGIYLPATPKGYEDDIKLAKSLGYNVLRKHIKIEPLLFYSLCDKLGMIVFQDMVNNSDYSFLRDTALPTVGLKKIPDKKLHDNSVSRAVFLNSMLETLQHLYNSPSVLYYTIFNEGWGQFCADDAYVMAKGADPTRIYDATSGWFTQKKSDVDSRHVYFKKIKLGKLTDKPIVISEFGGYSYRIPGHLFGDAEYGYRRFGEMDEFNSAVTELYRDEIKPLISRGISGLIYTQISDVEDETNGLITYDRRCVKLDPKKHRELMEELFREVKK